MKPFYRSALSINKLLPLKAGGLDWSKGVNETPLCLLNYFTALTVISMMIGVGRSQGKDAWITDGHTGTAGGFESQNVVLDRT